MAKANVIAEKLFHTQAVHLNPNQPFTWASGIQSPIYCDNRLLLSYPAHRDYIKSELANVVLEKFSNAECIAGVATAGISWGALVADQTKSSFIYVRSKKKEHGLGRAIEGKIDITKKVVVIEDLISTGKSSIQVVDILRENGLHVEGVLSIFSYGFKKTKEGFIKRNIPYHSLVTYEELLCYAESTKQFSDNDLDKMKAWQLDPENWNP